MKINDIITSAYPHFYGECRTNNVISESRTSFDILQDIILQTLRHFKNKNVSWEDGFKYIGDSFHLELFFSVKRRGKIIGVEKITDYERNMIEGDNE